MNPNKKTQAAEKMILVLISKGVCDHHQVMIVLFVVKIIQHQNPFRIIKDSKVLNNKRIQKIKYSKKSTNSKNQRIQKVKKYKKSMNPKNKRTKKFEETKK